MFKVAIKAIWTHKRRLLRTCSAVLLGVAFLAGTLIMGDTMRAGFSKVFANVYSKTDVTVQGTDTIGNTSEQRMLIPEDVLTRIKDLDDVDAAVPSINGLAQMIGSDGKAIGGQGPPTLGYAWPDNDPTNPYQLVEGHAPEAANEVIVNRLTAKQGKLHIGDSTIVRTPTPVTVKIVGVAAFGDQDSIGGEGFIGFTPSDARKYLLGGAAGYSDLSIRVVDGANAEHVAKEVQHLLPKGISARTSDQMQAQDEQQIGTEFLDVFEKILLVFTGVALLVASFSIYNTFSVILAQRTRESALLRAIGATRSQVLGSIAIEALAVGLVASVGGLVAGFGLAVGLTSAMRGFGVDLPGGLQVEPNSVVVSLIVGLVVTLLASLGPAVRASKVRPMEALRDSAVDHSDRSILRSVIGALLGVIGLGLVLFGALVAKSSAPLITGIGAVVLVVTVVVLGPVVARPAARVLGWPIAATRGASGELAVGNAMRNPARTAGTASALLIGVAVVVLFTVIGSSLKVAIRNSVTGTLRADLILIETGFSGSGISPELAKRLDQVPGVAESVGLGMGSVFLDGKPTDVRVTDSSKIDSVVDSDVVKGSMKGLGNNGLAISSDEAKKQDWTIGSKVNARFIDGYTTDLTVKSIYDRDDLNGPILLPRSIWEKHSTVDVDALNLVLLDNGADLKATQKAVDKAGKEFGAPKAQTKDEFAKDRAGQINQLLSIVYVLLALSIIIALMGIANTLALSIHERTRELGLLRAIGQTRPQLRSMVRWESVIIAVFGTVGGVGLGLFIGWGMMRSLASEGLTGFSAPVSQLVVIVVIGALAGVLAGLLPASRAAKLDVLEAISTE